MEGWKFWEGKKVFVLLKNKRTYQGTVVEIEVSKNSPVIWIILNDKYGQRVMFSIDEIDTIQEETKQGVLK